MKWTKEKPTKGGLLYWYKAVTKRHPQLVKAYKTPTGHIGVRPIEYHGSGEIVSRLSGHFYGPLEAPEFKEEA